MVVPEDTGAIRIGEVDPPPRQAPLELVEIDGTWVLREYCPEAGTGQRFSGHDDRLEAIRTGKRRMEADRHPCLLRWDTPESVGNIYWNEPFECLRVEFSDILDAWVVAPAGDWFVFAASESVERAYECGKTVLEAYGFKSLEARGPDGRVQTVAEHPFIRHSIAESGVRFDRRDVVDPDGTTDETADAPEPTRRWSAMRPGSSLAAAVPDLAAVEPVDTDGYLQVYRTEWTDGRPARIVALAPEYAGRETLAEAFAERVAVWASVADGEHVATIHDTGDRPATWVAAVACGSTLDTVDQSLSLEAKLSVLDDVAAALERAKHAGVYQTGVAPQHVNYDGDGGTVADWGVERAVLTAAGERPVTGYTAPEQLGGEVAGTTGVYRLGALAYRLLCGVDPFADVGDQRRAIREGAVTSPSERVAVPAAVDDVVARAMATTPTERYPRATSAVADLRAALSQP